MVSNGSGGTSGLLKCVSALFRIFYSLSSRASRGSLALPLRGTDASLPAWFAGGCDSARAAYALRVASIEIRHRGPLVASRGAIPSVRWAVAGGLVSIAALGALGALEAVHAPIGGNGLLPRGAFAPFDLDAETNLPSAFSASILAAAAALAFLLGAVRPGGARSWPWWGIGVLYAFMGADEWMQIHERLQDTTGVPWLELYIPLFVIGGSAWLVLIRRVAPYPPARLLLIAGAAAWIVAQANEKVQWHGSHPASFYKLSMVVEEILAMSGSFCFALGLLVVFVAARRHASADRWPGETA